ncbi:MAG: polyphosphate kinase 1 [Deltaproteobacteria bacterium]|nr:polyphosphate kinase 1 [Deltaproteobacteria bacterium]
MSVEKETFFNRELSWLGFARRVLCLVEQPDMPLFERVKFAGIMGMLHDEFFMKRVSGLKRQMKKRSTKVSLDGLPPDEEFAACRAELQSQDTLLGRLVEESLRPALKAAGLPLGDLTDLTEPQRQFLRTTFIDNIQPILTPLAVDAEHPFPFISSGTLNLAVLIPVADQDEPRFVRIKVPDNRPRWVALPDGAGFVPLERVIAANLDRLFPASPPAEVHTFRVTRGAEGEASPVAEATDADEGEEPGSILKIVTRELKSRRFAGVVRLQVNAAMPDWLCDWLAQRLEIGPEDVYHSSTFLGLSDLMKVPFPGHPELRYPPHEPATHPRLADLPAGTGAIFEEIARGDILVHHPYHSFDTSVLRFLTSAAADPGVLAIKLTIYRTSGDSPIVRALMEAARRGKQVAVLVEVTARFDEAPNIAWGKLLENEGVHVAYGVERLKTHVKLALVVREEGQRIRRYAHIGSGNYHTGTARIYEDIGILTCDPELCGEAAAVFDELTGATPRTDYQHILVAPTFMRARFLDLIRREIEHAKAGRPSGIVAKMNQLQDRVMISELYLASQAGVPIKINVRGLCCLRPGVPGMSENIQVFGVVSRFLEHCRIYRFENGGKPEFLIGSADWMKRNLDNRVETIVPVRDEAVKRGLAEILAVYDRDNSSVWDCRPDGTYVRRTPPEGAAPLAAQPEFIRLAAQGQGPPAPKPRRRSRRRRPAP